MAFQVKSFIASAMLAGALTGCGQSAPSPAANTTPLRSAQTQSTEAERDYIKPSQDLGQVSLEGSKNLNAKITPEKAEDKARARAAAWHADAELVFVGWGVAKFELLSVVNHVFYSPEANEVLVVSSFLRDKWQKAYAYDHKVVTAPAKFLQPLTQYKVDGHRALGLARRHFLLNKRPIALVTLSHPPKLPFAFWGVIGDATVVLIHASTGQSISNHGIDPFPKEWAKDADTAKN